MKDAIIRTCPMKKFLRFLATRLVGFLQVFFLLFIIFLGGTVLNIKNTSAVSVSTSSFDLHRIPRASSDYSWVNGILYDQHIAGVRSANKYQFQTSTLYPDGNLATLHFETNIVYSDLAPYNNPLVNLDYQSIIVCNASNNTIETLAPRLSYAVTQWYPTNPDLPDRTNVTLTFYGDVVLKGFTKNQATQIVCAIGSDSYAFIDATTSSSVQYVYFEQNPMDINFTDNETDALLQTQINQNQTIINQMEATNDWLTDDTAPSADTSSLGNAAGWLPPGPLDSILNLPVQFIQGIIGVFTNTNTCSPIVLPLGIIDYDLEIPCMRPFFELASVNVVWNTVGTIISAVLIFHTLKWLYKFVDDTLSFRENNSNMWGGL